MKQSDDEIIFSKDKFEVRLHEEVIEFINYPFRPASIFPSGIIKACEIQEIITNFLPPAIRIKNDELIMIPRGQIPVEELLEFGERNKVNLVSRVDVWSLILEEFLDTELGTDNEERVFQILEEQGISRGHCRALRQRLAEIMFSYNFDSCLWEWCHLGLYDLLNACSGNLIKRKFLMPEKEFQGFYFEVMKIACWGACIRSNRISKRKE